MSESNVPSRLFELLTSTDFELLSVEEKEFVFLHLSENEYRIFRRMHHSTEKIFQSEKTTHPHRSVKATLDNAFQKKHSSSLKISEFIFYLLNVRIPAYQAVLGCLLLVLTASWYIKAQTTPFTSTDLLAVADTIFIEKEKPARVDTVYLIQKEKMPRLTSNKNHQEAMEEKRIHPVEIAFPQENNIYITDFKNIRIPGSTIREDSLPEGFMVGIL